ncbi:hypothetical protein [Nocardioides sp. P5_C9_2]
MPSPYAAAVLASAAERRDRDSGVVSRWAAGETRGPEGLGMGTVFDLVDDGADLAVTRCFDQDDPDWGDRTRTGTGG